MIAVLHIITDSNIGGAGRVVLNYLRYADRGQFQPIVAIAKGSLLLPALERLHVQVYEVEGMADRSYNRQDVKVLAHLIDHIKPDLVHTHGSLSGRIAARRCHVPVVFSRHSAFPVPAKLRYPPLRWVNKLVNEHYADHIIAVSPATRENLTDGGISAKKITVVYNGTAPLPRSTHEQRSELRAQLGLSADTFVFGIFARLEDYKGHLYLLQAAKALKAQYGRKFHVLIAGTGPFESELVRAITQLNVGDVVTMLGFRDDVAQLLNIVDVQLNTSYGTEATSMALLEGMSLGLPTIASDYGGNPYVIKNGENGLLFKSQDSDALRQCMAQLMSQPQLLKSMRQSAETVFNENFTGTVFASNTEKIYKKLLKGEK